MLKKILVANRGEIACRVFLTAKKMGIATVAVYSDADRDALHVKMADEAVHIGASPSAESYLVIDKIIDACRRTGADAVHPGYGFLSENSDFRQALDKAGIIFIGPGIHAIESMGDKITSKRIAEQAGVNTIPGYTDVVRDADHAVEISEQIGYPVMLKASAGGGGKGMRVARNQAECRDGFERATNEAATSFGDTRIFIEKYIEQPRHIEIQLIADTHGNVVYLGERECSIQRRHQKVIEEAPSPFLNQATRQKMGEQSCALAKAVDYQSAGTVEFIADVDMNFYFLEMNTRLQVEHPVTELVTGQDLVELMIRVAAGEPLPLTQDDVVLRGWALESRIYAEDPLRNFLPSIGRLTGYIQPEGEHIRVDSGVSEGGEVSMYYDPMIAKLITYGDDRTQAIEQMIEALDNYYIRGVNHNISFLNALMVHPRFIQGKLTTNFIADEFPEGFSSDLIQHQEPEKLLIMATVAHQIHHQRATSLTNLSASANVGKPREWVVVMLDQTHAMKISPCDDGFTITYADSDYGVVTRWRLGEPLMQASINDTAFTVQIEQWDNGYRLYSRGAQLDCQVMSPRAAQLNRYMLYKPAPDMSKFLLSPMPGLLVKLSVQSGQAVKEGEELAVVEAMKMENSLRALQDGIVSDISAGEGDSLAVDQIIMSFE
ncbi:acetyl/propionyl/methylcrotonyl-CoA carboxylase subunit alpha [Porticoccaceae bacterium]|nr:acetyl/propionyl/methylcrotonyl-CoA carboxylase subunit alpha [Porticoccaceae bacterium]MDA8651501.1 acetyl/propionyl/methylcrotonyl-CoA carboxylase subunit alpha [Porticoccaceae bacterium]MDA8681167.1 acetyl/propionyl/methylcrotonyl-CoA carboxylase subunit alpha [Porticoccaceae bacterium]MDB2343369.1 acetyl/propionyl/methylcrotonyl-CoA carboxylase subunit alpha [Porticoccaceae bacterium]MDB2634487.1 acetyl/propionyl/methylcrotonyl-CoA carboxylase subunit alpha [Porticoccaceae bacterium]